MMSECRHQLDELQILTRVKYQNVQQIEIEEERRKGLVLQENLYSPCSKSDTVTIFANSKMKDKILID